jgi:hypothetical protein
MLCPMPDTRHNGAIPWAARLELSGRLPDTSPMLCVMTGGRHSAPYSVRAHGGGRRTSPSRARHGQPGIRLASSSWRRRRAFTYPRRHTEASENSRARLAQARQPVAIDACHACQRAAVIRAHAHSGRPRLARAACAWPHPDLYPKPCSAHRQSVVMVCTGKNATL